MGTFQSLFTTEYSDSLLMFLLKANSAEEFRDRMEHANLLDIEPRSSRSRNSMHLPNT